MSKLAFLFSAWQKFSSGSPSPKDGVTVSMSRVSLIAGPNSVQAFWIRSFSSVRLQNGNSPHFRGVLHRSTIPSFVTLWRPVMKFLRCRALSDVRFPSACLPDARARLARGPSAAAALVSPSFLSSWPDNRINLHTFDDSNLQSCRLSAPILLVVGVSATYFTFAQHFAQSLHPFFRRVNGIFL